MKSIIVSALIIGLAVSYPTFKQCDDRWGSNYLGVGGGETVCQAGCLMSSVSEIINDCQKLIDGQESNPGTLNEWLKTHGGYEVNLLVWEAVEPFGLTFIEKNKDHAAIKNYFDNGYAVILNVRSGHHWVLATGYNGSTWSINDSGFMKDTYEDSEVVQAGIYKKPDGCLTSVKQAFLA